jgi:large subunit ribosomal protein L21
MEYIENKNMYAVIKTGGKQYRVEANDVIKLEKIEGEVGSNVQFDQVLALAGEKGVEIGAPIVAGAVVSAEVLEQKKDTKVIIFKKKRRQNYRRKNGHRQEVTVVRILDVSGKGEIKKVVPAKKAAPKAEVADATVAEKAPKAEAKPKVKTAEKKEAAPKKPAAKKTTAKKKD